MDASNKTWWNNPGFGKLNLSPLNETCILCQAEETYKISNNRIYKVARSMLSVAQCSFLLSSLCHKIKDISAISFLKVIFTIYERFLETKIMTILVKVKEERIKA